jgi:hypothetical protein
LETPAAALSVTATSSNTALVPNANLMLAGSGADRTIAVATGANQTGSTTITLVVSDGTASTNETFILTVTTPPNASPTISAVADQTVNEDTATGALAFSVGDLETPAADLVVTASSSDTTLVPLANIALGGSGANRTVSVVPATNGFGSATITLSVQDGVSSAAETFVVTVNPVNDRPTISSVADQTIDEDGSTVPLTFTIGDVETPAALTVTATSSNTTLVPNSRIIVGGSGSSRTVAVTPAPNQAGATTIALTVADGTDTATTSFVVTVNQINDLPTISDIAGRTINEDSSTGPIPFTVGDLETPAPNLIVTATSSNTGLVPNANIALAGNGFNRTIAVVPSANQFGSTTITVTASDGSGSALRTFVVTVNSVNDVPTISTIPPQTVPRGSSTTIPFTVGDIETPAANLTLSATSSDQSIIPNANMTFAGEGANRSVTVTPLVSGGPVTISIEVGDGTANALGTFSVTVSDTSPPSVVAMERNEGRERFDQLASLAFTFSEDVSGSLDASDMLLVNETAGAPVDIAAAIVEWDAAARTARWDLSGIDFVEGRYSVTLVAAGIADAAGNALDGNGDGTPGGNHVSEAVLTWQGDTDRNLTIDFADFVNLANAFGGPGGWGDGDFDDDQVVAFDDFVAMSNNFGKTVPAIEAPTARLMPAAVDAVIKGVML